MESADQAAGERRVDDLLVQPLLRRGLIKPSGMTKAQFEDMQSDLRKRLAYMSAESLGALEECGAGMAGGSERDRFPIANKLLAEAGRIQPPTTDASPLIRKVFRHEIGQRAVEEGWAPELLLALRRKREWPGQLKQNACRNAAEDNVARQRKIEAAISRGEWVSDGDRRWRNGRLAAANETAALAGRDLEPLE